MRRALQSESSFNTIENLRTEGEETINTRLFTSISRNPSFPQEWQQTSDAEVDENTPYNNSKLKRPRTARTELLKW